MKAEKWLDEEGDWDWLTNVITGETLTAIEALTLGKRY